MKTVNLCLLIVATIAIVGCAHRHRSDPKPDMNAQTTRCSGSTCDAMVTVAAVGSGCIPDPIPNIDLKSGATGEKSITWTMSTPGYEFSRESYKYAIFIESDPFNEFKDVNVTGNGQRLTIKFNGTSSGRNYKYAITVRKSAGDKPFCQTLDPWMIS